MMIGTTGQRALGSTLSGERQLGLLAPRLRPRAPLAVRIVAVAQRAHSGSRRFFDDFRRKLLPTRLLSRDPGAAVRAVRQSYVLPSRLRVSQGC